MRLLIPDQSSAPSVAVALGVERIAFQQPAGTAWLAGVQFRSLHDAELCALLSDSRDEWWKHLSVVRLSPALCELGQRTLIPALLKSHGSTDGELTPRLREFRLAFAEGLAEQGFPIDDMGPADIVVNRPGLRSTAYDYTLQRLVGLHLDDQQKLGVGERDAAFVLAALNLGRRERYLDVVPLPMTALLAAIGESGQTSLQPREVKDTFLGTAAHPVILRIALPPGVAYILNTQNVIHDGATPAGDTPDVAFLMMGNPVPAGSAAHNRSDRSSELLAVTA